MDFNDKVKYDLSQILTNALLNIYELKSESELYKYLYIKCSIIIDNKKVNDIELLEFIFDELNITVYTDNGKFVNYKGEIHSLYSIAEDFLVNLEFRANLFEEVNIKEDLEIVYRNGYRKSIKYRNLNGYKDYIKYNRIMELNKLFNVDSSYSPGVEGFVNDKLHNPLRRSYEETLEANLAANRMLGSQTTTYISEKDLENYLVYNIELIEEGMEFIDRQVKVDGGIIDIIAKDKEDNICIIEVKIDEDKSIIWQSIHYPSEMRKRWKHKNIRMITIAPSYSEYIIKSLKSLRYVETKSYNIKVAFDKIEKLNIYDIL